MKILLVHELFMPDFAGGGEKLVYEAAKQLIAHGHEVRVLTTGDPAVTQHEGIPTKRLKRSRYLLNFAFYSVYQEAKWADIIQTATYNGCFPSWIVGKFQRKPVLLFVMSFWGKQWYELRSGVKAFLSKLIEKIQVNRSYTTKIFLSGFSQQFAQQHGVNTTDSVIIHPGVDTQHYQPLTKEPFVLFSGRFARQKGVYDVLAVARKLPQHKFVMMGWGEEEAKLKQEAPSNVTFSPMRLKDGAPFFAMYGKAQVFFLPSYGETFGLTVVEAMAAGCAIVSTVPLEYEGYVCKIGDIDDMAHAIDKLMKHPDKAAKMGEKNSPRAQQYTWEKFGKELEKVYEMVVKGK